MDVCSALSSNSTLISTLTRTQKTFIRIKVNERQRSHPSLLWRGGVKKRALISQYMHMTVLSHVMRKITSYICVPWSLSSKMDHSAFAKELGGGSVNVGEWYGVNVLSSIMDSKHLIRCDPAVHLFKRRI